MHPSSEHDGDRDSQPAESGDSAPKGGASRPDPGVTASAQLPELDERALAALGEVGRDWAGCMPARVVWERALPIDRHLDFTDPQQSRTGRFVHIRTARRGTDEDELEATPEAGKGDSRSR